MPSFAFMVFLATVCSFRRANRDFSTFASRQNFFALLAVIMLLGTGLIAPSPMGTCKPGFVTLPMPLPLLMVILPSSVNLTVAVISILSVASMSCPASLTTTASAVSRRVF